MPSIVVRNFLFHRVSPERDPLWDPMPPPLFDRILSFLKSRFRIVGLENLVLGGETRDGGKPICTLGFDDGYRDNVEHALPILTKHGCSASFYVVTDCIDEDRPTWTYELDHLLQSSNVERLRIDSVALPPALAEARFNGRESRLAYARALKPHLKTLAHDRRRLVLDELREKLADVEPARGLMMSWDDVRSLARGGFTIGSHSKTHGMLATMESAEEVREELALSRDVIQREIGEAPLAISYPLGSVNELVVGEAKAAGYRLGLATGQKIFELHSSSDPFRIPRIELYHESWLKTRLRIDGSLERWKRWLRR